MKAQTLKEYIKENHNGVQAQFARVVGVSKQQVFVWIQEDFIVITNNEEIKLYSHRRDL